MPLGRCAGTREAGGTLSVVESLVGRSSALSGEYIDTPDSAWAEGSWIAGEPGKC